MKRFLVEYFLLLAVILCINFRAYPQEKKYGNEKYVIVLDVQQAWTGKSMPAAIRSEMISSINTLISKTNPEKVIYIRSEAQMLSLTKTSKGLKFVKTTLLDFDSNLLVVNDKVFLKTTGDAFAVKEMTDIFEKDHATEIILTGLLAERCITNTTLGGLSRKYSIFLMPEAIAGKSVKSKKKALAKLTESGAGILSLGTIE